jgi:hypothetical protein
MGGNPGALGNGLSQLQLPATEYVEDIGMVTEALVFSEIEGKSNLEEVLKRVFGDDYPEPAVLQLVVDRSMERIAEKFVPIKLMNIVREQNRFNAYAACK